MMVTRGRKNTSCEKHIMIRSLTILWLVGVTTSAPLDIVEDLQTGLVKIVQKRSPISIVLDHAPVDLSTQHGLHHPAEHHLSTIKTNEPRVPSLASSAVINLVDHHIVQTHDQSNKVHVIEEVPTLGIIHAPGHAVSSSSKTTITTNVGHVIDEKGITPIVTHDISHVHESVAHVKDDEEHLRVLPLHAIVPTTREPVIVHHQEVNHRDEKASRNSIASKERKHKRRNTYTEAIGGYGVGWKYGGHGAGHGFYVTTFS